MRVKTKKTIDFSSGRYAFLRTGKYCGLELPENDQQIAATPTNNDDTGGLSVLQIVIIIYKMGINGTKSLFWKTSASSFDTAISVIEQMVAVSNNSGDAQGSLAGQPWRGC